MRISESELRSIVKKTLKNLNEGQDEVYLELFNALDTLSQLITKSSEASIDRQALQIFKANSGSEPRGDDDLLTLSDGKSLTFSELRAALKDHAKKAVDNFASNNLPLSQDLVNKYVTYAQEVVNTGQSTPAQIADQLKAMVVDDYTTASGGGVHPRTGDGVGIDRSLKVAWKKAATNNPEFWESFQTWTNIDYSGQDVKDKTWLDTFMRQMQIRLSDNQPLSCVGAPVYTDRIPDELKRMLINLPGNIHIQVLGEIEFASKTDANTQHTRAYDAEEKVKEKSADLTFISADRGAGDNMLTGAPGEALSDGIYNEIIVSKWSPGPGLVLPVRNLFKDIRDTINFAKAMYPAFQEFKNKNPGAVDSKFRKFRNDVLRYRKTSSAYENLIKLASEISGVPEDDRSFWALFYASGETISFFQTLFRNGTDLDPQQRYFYDYLIRYVTDLYDAEFNLLPAQELENYKGLLKYFFKL